MSAPASWLQNMANEVLASVYAIDLLAPIGCHHYLNRAIDQWEVSLFASTTEIVGGPRDGQANLSNFTVDLAEITRVFDRVDNFYWQALPISGEDDLGPHISIDGVYDGHKVWLRILAQAPDRYESGRQMSVYDMRLDENW